MESSSVRSSAPETQLISRRTLVRAGATAAWTVPLVQVVSAAPALAATNTPVMTWTQLDAHYHTGSTTLIDLTLAVTNNGGAITKNGLITIVLPMSASGYSGLSGATYKSGSGTTWTVQPTSEVGVGGTATVVVSFTVASPAGGTGSVSFTADNLASSGGSTPLVIQESAAANTTLAWQGLNGTYPDGDQTKLSVSASFKNTGPVSAQNPKFAFKLPVTASAVSGLPNGWTSEGSGADWTIKSSNPIAVGDVATLSSVIFTTTSGAGGKLLGSGQASNALENGGTTTIQAVSPPVLSIPTLATSASGTVITLNLVLSNDAPSDGGKPTGPVTVVAQMYTGRLTTPSFGTPGAGWVVLGYDGATDKATFRYDGSGTTLGLKAQNQSPNLGVTITYQKNSDKSSNTGFTLQATASSTAAGSVTKSVSGQQG